MGAIAPASQPVARGQGRGHHLLTPTRKADKLRCHRASTVCPIDLLADRSSSLRDKVVTVRRAFIGAINGLRTLTVVAYE